MASSQESVQKSIQAVMFRHNITILGDGKEVIVFGHGFGCDQDIWRHVAPAFSAQYQVILFDYMGCGKSDLNYYQADRYSSLQAYADDLVMICECLDLKNAWFVGHSVSGAIAMLASIQKPDLFKKIIAIGPSPRYLNDPPDYIGGFDSADISMMLEMMERNYFEWTENLAPIIVGSTGSTAHINELRNIFSKSDPLISKKFALVTFYCDIRSSLKEVPVPVSILYCLEDVIVPVEVIRFLQKNLRDCKVTELAASGHYPQLINPNAVIEALRSEVSCGI